MFPPFDFMNAGHMTMTQGPTGAAFGVLQPGNHIGAQLVNSPNTLAWNELQTPVLDAAQEFYSAVFCWTNNVDESGYVAVKQDDRLQAGMMQTTKEMAGVPPNWSIYFLVDDIEAAAAKVGELGGNLLLSVTPAGEVG